ncbi:MAG: hypothetical protein L0G22_13115, partial [Propionibacteriaceae bacterium]|nr:hypothetical protein [Propionibacteriaceae bacterium]
AVAVGAANRRRDPDAPRLPTSTTRHRLALGFALLAAAVAPALLTTRAISVRDALLPAGVLAVVAVALLWWLEPRRANGSLWGSRIPAGMHLAFGGVWLLAAAATFGFRWEEVGVFGVLPAITGMALLAAAGLAALVLGERALRADRSGRQAGLARVTGDLIDQRDVLEVLETLDHWWAVAGPGAVEHSPHRIRAVRREVLGRLRAAKLITEREEQLASFDPEPLGWSERRR